MAELYTYAVARIRAKEAFMLKKSDLEQVLSAKDEKTAVLVLEEKGFSGGGGSKSAKELLSRERSKTLEFLKEILGDLSALSVFFYPDDFHNIKAAVKSVVTGAESRDIFAPGGTLDKDIIVSAVKERDFSKLKPPFDRVCGKALSVFLKTGDGALCDITVDKETLSAIYAEGEKSDVPFIKDYAEIAVALCDIKIAARCCKMKKSYDFIQNALAECKSINTQLLARAASKSFEELCGYLRLTPYKNCADALEKSFSEFEKCCDNIITEKIKQQKSNPFTLGPIAAYYLAKETEIKAVRLVLSGIKNGLDKNLVKERLMDLYV